MKLPGRIHLLLFLLGLLPFVQNCGKARYTQVVPTVEPRPQPAGMPVVHQREPMGPAVPLRPAPPTRPPEIYESDEASKRFVIRDRDEANEEERIPDAPAPIVPPEPQEEPQLPRPGVPQPLFLDPTHYVGVPEKVAPQPELPLEPQPQPPLEPRPEPPPPQGSQCTITEPYRLWYRQPSKSVTEKLDLLFVVDTSNSIDNELKDAAKGVDRFIKALPSRMDLHIGVLVGHSPESKAAQPGVLVKKGSPEVLKSQDMSIGEISRHLQTKFLLARTKPKGEGRDIVADGGELGIYSLAQALRGEKLKALVKAEMFRPEAALAVIFISDENDICSLGAYPVGMTPKHDPDGREVTAFKKYCPGVTPRSVYARLEEIKKAGHRDPKAGKITMPVIISAIVYTDPETVPTRKPGDKFAKENEVGYGYLDMVKLNGGIAVDIGTGDIPDALKKIGDKTLTKISLKTDFQVYERCPHDRSKRCRLGEGTRFDERSLCVLVDGKEVASEYRPDLERIKIENGGRAESLVELFYYLKMKNPACLISPEERDPSLLDSGDGNDLEQTPDIYIDKRCTLTKKRLGSGF